MDFLLSVVSGLNSASNAVGGLVFFWIARVPGELSITIISAIIGVLLLILFKYTSNQKAIGRVRDEINAELLAIKLFKDSLRVTFVSQARLFWGSLKLLAYSLIPMLIMIVPVSLVLAQLGLWYQARAFRIGEPITVKLQLNRSFDDLTALELEPAPGFETVVGPVRVFSKKEVYWKLRALAGGEHRLVFRVGDTAYEKRVAVGASLMRLSRKRPSSQFLDALLHPLETPLPPASTVRAIELFYPSRDSKICGTNYWIIYFFVVSMVFAFVFKPILKVRI
ncbi:MAG: hypothetical protein JXA30_21800 [Deltaproteobacteria bacterium]|nr:hypothetical protein [Deltaproteobacteria bacterium]